MKRTKETRGPYKAQRATGAVVTMQVRTIDESKKKGGLVIADVYGANAEQSEANARLLAASYMLRSVVRGALDRWPQVGSDEEINGGDMVEWFAEWAAWAESVMVSVDYETHSVTFWLIGAQTGDAIDWAADIKDRDGKPVREISGGTGKKTEEAALRSARKQIAEAVAQYGIPADRIEHDEDARKVNRKQPEAPGWTLKQSLQYSRDGVALEGRFPEIERASDGQAHILVMGEDKESVARDVMDALNQRKPASDLLTESRALLHLAETLNSRQHAGLEVTPTMWGMLYDVAARTKVAVIAAEESGL